MRVDVNIEGQKPRKMKICDEELRLRPRFIADILRSDSLFKDMDEMAELEDEEDED